MQHCSAYCRQSSRSLVDYSTTLSFKSNLIRKTTLITLIHLKPAKEQASSKRKSLVDSMSMEEDEDDEFFDARERLGQIFL